MPYMTSEGRTLNGSGLHTKNVHPTAPSTSQDSRTAPPKSDQTEYRVKTRFVGSTYVYAYLDTLPEVKRRIRSVIYDGRKVDAIIVDRADGNTWQRIFTLEAKNGILLKSGRAA